MMMKCGVDEQAKYLCLWEPPKQSELQNPVLTQTTIRHYLFNFTQHFQSWLTLSPATCAVLVLWSAGLLHKLFSRDPPADPPADCLSYFIPTDQTTALAVSRSIWMLLIVSHDYLLQRGRLYHNLQFDTMFAKFQYNWLNPYKINYWENPTLTNLLPNHLSAVTSEKVKTNTKYNEAGWAQNQK